MRVTEVFAHNDDSVPVDHWLFDGELVRRWDGAGFHTPVHAAAVANVSRILSNWCRATSGFRAFGYGCPYALARNPDTLVTFDASVIRRDVCEKLRRDDTHIEGVPSVAIEVIELDEDRDLLTRWVEASLRAGIGSVWMGDAHEEIVAVHRRCPVAEIFE